MFIGKQERYLPMSTDNIMNHVYWQTRVVFTNAIDNIMNHVYWKNNSGIHQCH